MKTVSSRVVLSLACTALASMTAQLAQAASLHVTAADALSNKAYDLKFAPPAGATQLAITPLATKKSSVRSIVYVANEKTAKVDLIAADNGSSMIVRYAGAAGAANTVWSGTGTGPMSPIGMSVDSFGNIFVGRGDQGRPELWVLKPNPVQPPAGGAYLAPVLIDKTSFGPTGSLTSIRLMDTLVVRTSVAGGLGAGDLLVLLSDGRVMRYSAASISNFILHNTPVGTPTTLIAATNFSNGHVPTSIAIWPTDGSLLIPTVDGAVRRYSLTTTGSTQMPNFATGLGSEATGVGQLQGLIRTFVSSAGTFAVVDNPKSSKIFELGAPPEAGCPNLAVVCNAPVGTISTVANPVALAVTDAGANSTDCVNTGGNPVGCTLLGGTVIVGVSSANAGGSVIALSCTVDDPRFDTGLGKCDGSDLVVSSVCPGYPSTKVPGYLCGASGASQHAMTFLKFEEQGGFTAAPNDLLVSLELTAEDILGTGGGIPICPQLTMGWAPLATEGTISEGNFMMEPTSYCGSTKGLTPGHSLMLVGAQINNGTDLVALANTKFDRLGDTITAAGNMSTPARTALSTCVGYGKTLLNASNLTATNRAACAAHEAFVCDGTVVSTQFANNTGTLSALSEIKGRLENLIMHLDNRIVSPGSTPPWPQTEPLSGAVTTCDIDAPSSPGTPGSSEVSSNGSATIYNVTWTASNDSGTGTVSNPGPYASGVARYHVYVDAVEASGSPLATTSLQITINDTTPTSHPITITADDNATGGTSPVFNTSGAAATAAQCTDNVNNTNTSDTTPDGVCDVVASPP